MAVSPVVNMQNRVAQALVVAQSAKGAFASALSSATSSLTPNSSTSSTNSPQQSYTQSLTNVQNQLNGLFQSAGIDTSQEIQLSLSPDGTVQLANNHPDAAKIQQVLANHPELTGMLQSLSNAYQQANPSAGASPTSEFLVTLVDGQATGSVST